MKTHFAPPERLKKEDALAQYKAVSSYEFVREIFDALPYIAIIVNKERQVVFSNGVLLEMFGISDITEAVGLRPGELVGCIHHDETEFGCGTSASCRYCDAIRAVLESWERKEKVSREARITSVINGREVHFDLLVTSTPFEKDGNEFAIVSISDIGDEKRRRSLERVFFHDIINTAGGLKGLMDLITRAKDPAKVEELFPIAYDVSEMLIDEILAQKDLLAAENNDLTVMKKSANSLKVARRAVEQIMHHPVSRKKTITIDPDSESVDFTTDENLLKRVLVNMLKNALEASSTGEEIVIGCRSRNETVKFAVSNPGHIPPDVQAQLFQRSFSTKGKNRGIGTYSMKLFTEDYLGGELSFTSSKENGTSFVASIPAMPNGTRSSMS